MIRAAAEQGTAVICCTPHLYEMDARLVERAREVRSEVVEAVREAGLNVRLLLGFEVDLTVAATSDPETLGLLCIQDDASAGSARPLLIEMPYSNWPPFFEETIHRISTQGFIPIIAHPERNDRVQRSPDVLTGCLDAGAVFQGTAGSLSHMFRRESQKTFYELLARGWFSLLASDAHSDPDYTWSLDPLLEDLGSRITPEDRELLVNVNPGRVLEGKRPIPIIAKRSAGKGWRLFK